MSAMQIVSFGIEGAPVDELLDIEPDPLKAIPRILRSNVLESVSRDRLLDIVWAWRVPKLRLKFHFYPVRSVKHPCMQGFDSNAQPWERVGNLYMCTYKGVVRGNELHMTSAGEETDIWVWCCVAAS